MVIAKYFSILIVNTLFCIIIVRWPFVSIYLLTTGRLCCLPINELLSIIIGLAILLIVAVDVVVVTLYSMVVLDDDFVNISY